MMAPMRRDLPSGTVTFLFTDVEGSTRLLQALGADAYAGALAEHRRILREACGAHGGVEVDTQGDAVFVAFPTAPGALRAAEAAQAGLAAGPIRVRMGIHTGSPHLAQEGYVGVDVHRAARIAACGHGGQVLISASTAAIVGRDDVRDLGEHRLKDLSAPERIFQLGEADFPPLKSLHQTNLPIPATPFLGRQRELAGVVDLLARDDVHLLTLTGPGGTGKTRLAAQAAAGLSGRYPHGVWWVPLAALRDHHLVLPTAERVLGARDGLAEHIAGRGMLLLLDNFEQVVEAAPDVAGLLAACPNLDLLVTSREPLRIAGEQEYAVPPLAHDEGVDLFVARARAVDSEFVPDDAVSAICRRLDELPLALELAAARVKALSARQILERLEQRLPLLTGGARDLPERQRTLRATIAWSEELLTSEEQRLFARLAIFRGGCTLEAAEQVAAADLDTMQSLVDKSLLRYRARRFGMLETIREYAAERLGDSGEAELLRLRHTEHFVAYAQEAEPHLRGDSADWLDRLDREHDNLRAALDELEASGAIESAQGMAAALSRFWYLRGHLVEGGRYLERLLRADERPTAARARALNGAAIMAVNLADPATARLRAEEALALHQALGDAWGAAYAGLMIGLAAAEGGDFVQARPLLEEAEQHFRELRDGRYALLAVSNLAWVIEELGDLPRARVLHEETLRQARMEGNPRMEAGSLDALAAYARDEGRLEDSLAMLREGLRIYRDRGERLSSANCLSRFAVVHGLAGRSNLAVRLIAASVARYKELGVSPPAYVANRNEQTLAAIRGHLDEAALAEAWQGGRALTADEAIALALEPAG